MLITANFQFIFASKYLLFLLRKLLSKISQETQHPEPKGFLVWLAFPNRQRLAHPVKETESSTQSTCIALPSINSVKSKFLDTSIRIEIHMHQLRGKGQYTIIHSTLRLGSHEWRNVLGHLPGKEPDTVGLHRINSKTKVILFNIERILQLKASQSFEVFFFPDRAYNSGDKLKVISDALSIVLGSDFYLGRQYFLGANYEILGLNRKG
mmetsp:Transcript_27280/g.58425  ORF Transcript_27280/g.58425 Transcript_27280/m.58425 type:complete len:209 (+) Transcript_27280:271-897(+)